MKKANILIKDYSEEKTTLLGRAADYITNVMNVRLFASKDLEIERFNQLKGSFISKGERSGFYLTGYYIVQGIFSSIYITILLIVLIQKHESSQISPGDFAFVVMINFEIINMLFRTSHVFRDYVMDWGTVDQALAILDHIPEVLDKADAKPLKITQGSIIFEEVAFSYKDTAPLFCNKSITILPGQKVGLVGYSGGGKSTFVNLILRLYDVKEGRILIDAQDIRGCTQDSLRLNVAMIPQDPSLFHRTIMENIRYGRSEASDEEVTEAAKRAHAHEFIINLPDGYNSLVGERGVKLSGGQRQRVAIARAILKNAPILMLDEATSQLDSVTEGHIQESLRELMHGKTTLVIAHRLSTLLNMDRILVFDKGKIIEDGTHTELLNNNWLYKTLWDTQIGGFLLDKRDDDNTTS
jgi:ATP-binding cassette subfamily B protein